MQAGNRASIAGIEDYSVSEVNEDDVCQDDLFARDGQQIRGIQLSKQMMDQL